MCLGDILLVVQEQTIVRTGEMIIINRMRRGSERPKKSFINTINKYLNTINLTRDMTLYISQLWQKIHAVDTKQWGNLRFYYHCIKFQFIMCC